MLDSMYKYSDKKHGKFLALTGFTLEPIATIANVDLQEVYMWLYYLNGWREDSHVYMRDCYYFDHLQ